MSLLSESYSGESYSGEVIPQVAFPAISAVYGMRRILRVNVRQQRRKDLKLERIWWNRHIVHSFEIPWQTLSKTERTTLDDFFKTSRGRIGVVDFTDPWDNTAYTCRFDSDDFSAEEPVNSRWQASIRLTETANFKALKPAVTTFPLLASGKTLQLPYRMTRTYRTEIQTQQDDTEKRFEDYAVASGIQRWAVGGEVLSDADASSLLAAWEGNGGPFREFSFTEPETATVYAAAHFIETECTHELAGPCRNGVRLTVEELP